MDLKQIIAEWRGQILEVHTAEFIERRDIIEVELAFGEMGESLTFKLGTARRLVNSFRMWVEIDSRPTFTVPAWVGFNVKDIGDGRYLLDSPIWDEVYYVLPN